MIFNPKLFLQIGNITAVISTIFVNALANTLPINNRLTGDISDSIPNLFVPSGITFSIWGIIYFLLIAFIIFQSRDLFSKVKTNMPFLDKISFYLILASIANISWIILWHYEQIILSLIVMVVLFLSLLKIYLRLNIGKEKVNINEKIFVNAPFSIYIGWISVALIANFTSVLVTIGWNGFGISETIWTIVILIIVSIITLIIIINRFDVLYALVIIWALLGIIIKRVNQDPVYGVQNEIAFISGLSIIIILISIAIIYFRKNYNKIIKLKLTSS
jgi:hypothetical protein